MIDPPEIKLRMAPVRLQKQNPESVMRALVEPVVRDMLEEIKQKTRWESVREGYSLNVMSSQNVTIYSIQNDSGKWGFEEFDIPPHSIPQPARTQPPALVPRAQLLTWMGERGIPLEMIGLIESRLKKRDWFVEHPGSKGDYIATETFEKYKQLIYEAHASAINTMLQVDGPPVEIL